jgi:hypothetical protein
MEFAILTVMMLLITGVLMCYMGYNNIKQHHLLQQLEMVEEAIENCERHYKLKKLIILRKKIKKKIDNL